MLSIGLNTVPPAIIADPWVVRWMYRVVKTREGKTFTRSRRDAESPTRLERCAYSKDGFRIREGETREMFVPLSHAPGHAQCDFGEALIGGVERKAHCFVIGTAASCLSRGDHQRARISVRLFWAEGSWRSLITELRRGWGGLVGARAGTQACQSGDYGDHRLERERPAAPASGGIRRLEKQAGRVSPSLGGPTTTRCRWLDRDGWYGATSTRAGVIARDHTRATL